MATKETEELNGIYPFDDGFLDDDFEFGHLDPLGNNIDSVNKNDAETMKVSLNKAIYGGVDCVEVYAYRQDELEKKERAVLLARVTTDELTMFPLVSASYRHDFLTPKYDELTAFRIASIEESWPLPENIPEFDELLKSLPVGFGRHAIYGLGLKWEYRLITDAICAVQGVTELLIEPGDNAGINGHQFHLGVDRFSAIRCSIDSITARARKRSLRDRRLLAFNELLHAADPTQFQRQFAKVKAGELYELVKLGGRTKNRSPDDRRAAASIILDDAAKIAKEQPTQLLELRSAIEYATLNELIVKIESMLQKDLTEPKWQTFFREHPFVLGLAFPHPVILIQDQAHVGGTMIRGKGESIVDFLFAQRFTGNLALIEIKRPSTSLLETKPFRGDLYAPHKQLTSAMAQVLDQRFQLLSNFAIKSHDSSLKDTHVSAVHCVVIAGMAPLTIEEKRSFDLFRHSSKDVVVVTFDELLAKLKEILRLMTAHLHAVSADLTEDTATPGSQESQDDDCPF